ncbi:MAG: extracellular solute-binding protein [Lachnospiraceae bacterium]|mgnify:FL=1|nr:extracellular solute-binding protein [Lachnospiraceae bacterium]
MKMKKVLALLTVGAMLTGMLTGCGGKEGASGEGSSQGGGDAQEESTGGDEAGGNESAGGDETGGSQAETSKDPITFKYYNADGKNGNWSETAVGAAITEATGVTLEISYPVSSTGDPSEDISLMIAEDNYPDMIYSKASVTNLYEAGALIDMTDLIEQYGPNIKKMYGDEFEKLKWGSGDEGIYQLSYAGVRGQIFSTGGTCQIQYAVLKENDYKYPTTLAEYEAMIKSYLEAHPTTEDGLETIGITMSASDWHWMITLGNPAGFIADAAPDNGQWLIDENYNCTYKHSSDDEKEYFRWLSRMYDEGILDPNFATQTDDDYIAKLASGRVVAITDANWHYLQAHAALKAENKLDKTYCGLPVTMNADDKAPTLMYQGLQVGYGLAITKSCEDPVRAIQFLDYLCSDEGAILYRWGIEGEHYFLDENGKRYRTPEEIAKAQSDPDYSKTTGIGNYTGFPIYGDGVLDDNGDYMTPSSRESVIAEYNEEEKAACDAWGVEMLIDIFPQPDEFQTPPYSPLWAYAIPQELSNNVTILDEIAFPGLVKCVTEPESSFDANWDAMIAELEANGLEETNQMMTEFLATKIN